MTNHEQMLRIVNGYDCTTLINIDEHSDLCEISPSPMLTCGSWVSFVRQKREMHYKWVYPYRSLSSVRGIEGDCSAYGIFPRQYSRVPRREIGYRSCSSMDSFTDVWLSRICSEVVHASFCRSPAYTYQHVQFAFLDIARKNGFKVMRGDMRDRRIRNILLPEERKVKLATDAGLLPEFVGSKWQAK